MRLTVALLLCCLCAWPSWSMEESARPADFDIPSQPLSAALLQFSAQSGIQVLAADARLPASRVRAVRGRMAPATALRRLLSGTGLSFRHIDAGTIVLVRATAAAAPASRPAEVSPRNDVA